MSTLREVALMAFVDHMKNEEKRKEDLGGRALDYFLKTTGFPGQVTDYDLKREPRVFIEESDYTFYVKFILNDIPVLYLKLPTGDYLVSSLEQIGKHIAEYENEAREYRAPAEYFEGTADELDKAA